MNNIKPHKYIWFYLSMMVILFAAGCSKPTNACFIYTPHNITIDSVVVFDARCSEMASHYAWNFGDGTKDSITNSLIITHQFSKPGSYHVMLEAMRKDRIGFVRRGTPKLIQTIVVQ